MLWKGRRQSDNVEDVTGQGGGGGFPGGLGRGSGGPVRIPIGRSSGGMSISTIVILVILYFGAKYLFNIDLLQSITGDGSPGGSGTVTDASDPGSPASDETKEFVKVVLAETEDVWNGIFQAQGLKYEEPTLTLFRGQIESACGYASAASGPFYCPGDHKVYLDTDFFDQLSNQFGASGDFAEAYVVAHEVGHHVQNLTGILPKFNQMRQQMSEVEANQMSIRVELQADCFAGVWGHYTDQKGLLEKGDLEEALNAAQKIGDDTLQKKMQGYVVPESFNHGTSKQRVTWFNKGFQSGKLSDCDTFNNPV